MAAAAASGKAAHRTFGRYWRDGFPKPCFLKVSLSYYSNFTGVVKTFNIATAS